MPGVTEFDIILGAWCEPFAHGKWTRVATSTFDFQHRFIKIFFKFLSDQVILLSEVAIATVFVTSFLRVVYPLKNLSHICLSNLNNGCVSQKVCNLFIKWWLSDILLI